MARELKTQGIVLTIRRIGESDATQQGCEEGTWCAQAIDAQGIVRSVLVRPFLMGYESWRQGIQFEVAHAIRAYHHRSLLLVESIHDGLQRLGRRIEVVAIQLDGKASAILTIDGLVPTSANTQIRPVRHDDVQFVAMR